jgi:hypothetical protein
MSVEFGSQLDETSRDEAEQFWRREVEAIASAAGQPGEWDNAYPRSFGNGITPIPREDRPVCDGRNWTQDRAFCIWEFNLVEGVPGITTSVEDNATLYGDGGHWLDAGSARNRVARTLLSIWLERSEETVQLTRQLLALWMAPSTTVTELGSSSTRRPASTGGSQSGSFADAGAQDCLYACNRNATGKRRTNSW